VAKRVTVRFRTQVSTIFFWVMAVAGLALVVAAVMLPILARNSSLNRELQRLEQENDGLREQIKHFQLEEQALRSDPVYNETLARRELGLVKPGERSVWSPPRRPPTLTHSRPDRASASGSAELPPSWPALARLGFPGRYLSRAFSRLATDLSARRDGLLLAMAMLTAAFLLFGRHEKPTDARTSRLLRRTRA